ncbi:MULTISPECIES: hypothetical protein [Curtobacterium]|uniref:hypothetical protein n=1 Tax=Curtobacterium TaxID=2034 RepID=UPI0015F757E4|nr:MULTISPECIES: hypothetical protein [Curtobacterium]MCS6563467.1 hypothetical protein [Curtobacterium flaccumfaciens pv. poinsettiae]MDT0234041.1 hypothetical protein [Curtobacterium sp. BRB10]UXN29545.1 hypothetical protein N8D75_04445 [Curtobacterium flaccumfaciens]
MNTEPPQGDDLQRMLVSMKQNVLERATPRPKRRRVRPGIALGIVGLLAVGTATGAVALTLSQQNTDPVAAPTQTQQAEPSPSATTPSSAPITGAPIPKPTPTPTPAPPTPPASDVRLPGDCYLLVPDDDYDRFFGAARHESMIIAPGGDREPDGNDRIQGLRGEHEVLSCTWQNEGVEANLTLAVGHVADFGPGMSEDMVERRGGTCTDRLGGRLCQSAGLSGGGGTLTTTRFERDDIVIAINQTDFPTDGLLDAVVGEIWGD